MYLSGGPGELKSKPKNDSSNSLVSSVDPLVGGETVFYGPRNKIVAEVNYIFRVWIYASFKFWNMTICFGSSNTILVSQVAPTEGTALLHLHGDKCLLHEARNVSKGVKYVFRSDVVFAWRMVHDLYQIIWYIHLLKAFWFTYCSKYCCVILIFNVGNMFSMEIYAIDNLPLRLSRIGKLFWKTHTVVKIRWIKAIMELPPQNIKGSLVL